MTQWSSDQYLKFKQQRTQPAVDLAKRIASKNPYTVLDIGCGPGNSTAVLQKTFPTARIVGIDSSLEMIEKAKTSYADIEFRLCDITVGMENLENYDVIFSNACLQWVPDHKALIPGLFAKLNDGGALAVQIPMNDKELLFVVENEVLSEPHWGFTDQKIRSIATLSPEEYFDILASCTNNFEIWETVYYHRMPSVEAMVEWIKGTSLRPYLSVLDNKKAKELETEITARAAEVYSKQENGEYIFKFRRMFFVAQKTGEIRSKYVG